MFNTYWVNPNVPHVIKVNKQGSYEIHPRPPSSARYFVTEAREVRTIRTGGNLIDHGSSVKGFQSILKGEDGKSRRSQRGIGYPFPLHSCGVLFTLVHSYTVSLSLDFSWTGWVEEIFHSSVLESLSFGEQGIQGWVRFGLVSVRVRKSRDLRQG